MPQRCRPLCREAARRRVWCTAKDAGERDRAAYTGLPVRGGCRPLCREAAQRRSSGTAKGAGERDEAAYTGLLHFLQQLRPAQAVVGALALAVDQAPEQAEAAQAD